MKLKANLDDLERKIFARNLRRYLGDRTQLEVCEALGIKTGTMSEWINGKKYPRIGKIELLANYFGIKKSDLIEDKCELDFLPPPRHAVPILGRISAGDPEYAAHNIDHYDLVHNERIDYGLIVKGDSMIGARIYEDDIVYAAKDTSINNGDIVIALINREDATIKRFYRYNGEVILKPENPTLAEQRYKPDAVMILGKVVEVKFKVK